MYTINLFSKSIVSSSFVLMSAAAMAHEGHHIPAEANASMSMTTESVMPQHAQHQAMTTPTQAAPQASTQHVQQMNQDSTAHTHDHRKEHGAQIYAVTTVDNKWLLNEDGDGGLKSEFETRIGTDENKLFIKVHADKQEAHKAEYDALLLRHEFQEPFGEDVSELLADLSKQYNDGALSRETYVELSYLVKDAKQEIERLKQEEAERMEQQMELNKMDVFGGAE